MHAPQILFLTLIGLSVIINVVEHGKPRKEPYNGYGRFIGAVVQVSLLAWGGFFK